MPWTGSISLRAAGTMGWIAPFRVVLPAAVSAPRATGLPQVLGLLPWPFGSAMPSGRVSGTGVPPAMDAVEEVWVTGGNAGTPVVAAGDAVVPGAGGMPGGG